MRAITHLYNRLGFETIARAISGSVIVQDESFYLGMQQQVSCKCMEALDRVKGLLLHCLVSSHARGG